jgi:hypothetical protein
MIVKLNFKKKVNFLIYESFFRTFCKNKRTEMPPHALVANFESFKEGIKHWYGGKSND